MPEHTYIPQVQGSTEVLVCPRCGIGAIQVHTRFVKGSMGKVTASYLKCTRRSCDWWEPIRERGK